MNGNPFTEAEIARMYALRAQGMRPPQIATMMNKKVNSIYHRFRWDAMTPETREEMRRARAGRKEPRTTDRVIAETELSRPTPEMLRDRDIRSMLPHRDLTGAFFNDPPVGLSALEGRR